MARARTRKSRLDRLAQLQSLVAGALDQNPFQRARLEKAGCAAVPSSLEEFAARFPLTLKSELSEDQRRHPPFGTNFSLPLEQFRRIHQTSSTTGSPLRWLDTEESWQWMVESWTLVLRAAEVAAGERVLFAFSFGPFLGFWVGFDAAQRLGCAPVAAGGMDSRSRVNAIFDFQVTTLCCTPTYALRLGETVGSSGLDPVQSPVRRIIVAGETGGSVPAVRARIESLWQGARVFDHYGMTEVGPVTFQCTARDDAVHVLDERFLVEVIDPRTQASLDLAREAHGELVLTPLCRAGQPVLRYRTGDRVHSLARARCACGRTTLMLQGGILARADDMVVVRGVNLFPSAVDEVVRSIPGVVEYRVEISEKTAMTEVNVDIESDGSRPDQALAQELEAAFRRAFSLRIPVRVVPPQTLPRFELKARRWVKVAG